MRGSHLPAPAAHSLDRASHRDEEPADNAGVSRRTSLRVLVGMAAGALALAGFAGAESNPTAIVPPDAAGPGLVGSATPSLITVTGAPIVDRLSVMLNGFSHTTPDDVDAEVIGPTGQRVVLMSDAGGVNPVSGLDLTFDDIGNVLPDEGTLVSTVYMPANYGKTTSKASSANEADPDVFPLDPNSLRPSDSMPRDGVRGSDRGSSSNDLSTFNGTDPNGTWGLYVVDDSTGDTGSFAGGWTLAINTPVSAVGVARFAARTTAGRVTLSWKTGSQANALGFNVFRLGAGRSIRVNRNLVAAHVGLGASTYRVVDKNVRAGASYTYRLQVVRADGSRAWSGFAAVRAA